MEHKCLVDDIVTGSQCYHSMPKIKYPKLSQFDYGRKILQAFIDHTYTAQAVRVAFLPSDRSCCLLYNRVKGGDNSDLGA